MARQLVAFMDRSLIVLNKPAGLVAQGGRHALEPKTMTLEYVLEDLTKSLGLATKPLPVHRLDKPTTGALVLARNPQTAQTLSAQLRRPTSNDITKTYLALVHGSFEPHSTGQVRKSMCVTNGRVSFPKSSEESKGKGLPTHTTWRCLESNDGVSLMELGLRTGLKHQLRITMAEVLNAPILGDPIYGSEDGPLMLHSARVEILRYLRKPVSGSRTYRLGIAVPPPTDFLATCRESGLSIGHEWIHSPVRVTINGSDIPYDNSSPLDEQVVVDSLRGSHLDR